VQLIYLSTASQSSLHPFGCALCLTVLPNLIDLLVNINIALNMSFMNVEANGDAVMVAIPTKDGEEMLVLQSHFQLNISSQK
jgi:hypothetical protein